MVDIFSWLLAIPVLGFLTGARTMTPMAVLCWFAYAGNMGLSGAVMRSAGAGPGTHGTGVHGTWAFWTAKLVTCVVFTVLAVGELIGDKLPKTPNRTSLMPLLARIGFGGLVGAIAATGLNGSALEGGLLGGISALAGTFVTYHLRAWLSGKIPPMAAAVTEDVLVIGFSVLAMGVITG